MSGIELSIKLAFLVLCAAVGAFYTRLWIRQAVRGDSVSDYGLNYYVGSLGLFVALIFGIMLGFDQGWLGLR